VFGGKKLNRGTKQPPVPRKSIPVMSKEVGGEAGLGAKKIK